MSRLCVCVTGQLRQSDEALWKLKSVTARHATTFVFSVWDTIGSKVDGALNIDQIPRIFEPEAGDALPHRWLGYRTLWQALPVLQQKRIREFQHQSASSIHHRVTSIFRDAIVDVEASDLLNLEFPSPGEDKNSLRMLYKFWRANEIKRRVERSEGVFDYVIRMRPDQMVTLIDLDEIDRHASQNTILVDAFVPDGAFVYDNFAAGSSNALDAYCSLFGRAMAIPQDWDHIHRELHHHLERVGLRYARYPHLGGLAQDRRISSRDVEDSLHIMRESHQGWTPTHAITLAAMQAATLTMAGDAAGAVAALSAIPDKDIEVTELDGYFATSAKAFRAADAPSLAAACAAISMRLRPAKPAAWPDWAADIMVEAIARGVTSSPASDLDGLAHSILKTLDGATVPFHALVRTALGPIEAIVLGQVRELMGDAAFQTRLIETLASLDLFDASTSLVENFAGDAASKHLLVLALKAGRAERAGDLDDAVRWLEELIGLRPDDVQSIYRMADQLKDLGRYGDADYWQRKAIALDPTHAGAYRQMAEIGLHMGRIDDARDFIARALDLDGSSYDAEVLKTYVSYRTAVLDGAAMDTKRPPEGYVPRPSFLRLPGFSDFYERFSEQLVPI